MPVEDAFELLSSSYRAYQHQQTGSGGGGGGRGVVEREPANLGEPRGLMNARGLVTDPHPPTMQALLNALQENRPLSVMEYDRLIRYLSERRDRQAAEEPPQRSMAGSLNQPPYQSEFFARFHPPHQGDFPPVHFA